MDTFGLLVLSLCCLLQFCVTVECRPESSVLSSSSPARPRTARSIDQMVFPDSSEVERVGSSPDPIMSLQMRRPLSPTPAPSSECRQIKVIRHSNGTLGHRYVDCENSTPNTATQDQVQSVGGRFGPTRSSASDSGDQNKRTQDSEDDSRDHIVFPDTDSIEGTSPASLTKEPACAQGQHFCTEDSSYPKSKIEQLLQRVGNLNDLLQTDVEDDTELAQRVDVPGEETFCDYDSRMEYPTKALSRDEKWLTVVNHSNYTQGIRMEICRNIDRPCKMSEIFPYSIKTKCVQKYQYRQLLALHEGQLRREYFSMPTCCLCTFSKM